MSVEVLSPFPEQPDLLHQVLEAAPELATFAAEAWQAVGIEFTDAPETAKRKEAREALLVGEHALEKLKAIPDLPEDLVETLADQLLDHVFQLKAGTQ